MIGIDLVEVARVNPDEKFLTKIAFLEEIEYINRFCDGMKKQKAAALFCVKEAVMKALGLGLSQVSFKDIKMTHEKNGKPVIELFGRAKTMLESMGGEGVEVSISHTEYYATAVALVLARRL